MSLFICDKLRGLPVFSYLKEKKEWPLRRDSRTPPLTHRSCEHSLLLAEIDAICVRAIDWLHGPPEGAFLVIDGSIISVFFSLSLFEFSSFFSQLKSKKKGGEG